MRRQRSWIRSFWRGIGTIGIGVLLGFLVPTVMADLAPKPDVQGTVAEAPLARNFINAFAAGDQTALDAFKVRQDIKNCASRFRADYSRVDSPVHLGSYVGGGYSVHAYGLHVVRKDGTDDTLSWRIVTAGGEVALLLPPSPIEAE